METPVLDIAVKIHCARLFRKDDADPRTAVQDADPRTAVQDARELIDAFLTPDPKPTLRIVKENICPIISGQS